MKYDCQLTASLTDTNYGLIDIKVQNRGPSLGGAVGWRLTVNEKVMSPIPTRFSNYITIIVVLYTKRGVEFRHKIRNFSKIEHIGVS